MLEERLNDLLGRVEVLFEKRDRPGEDEQWRLVRNTGIGGSDVSVLLGLSGFESPFSLWTLKTGMVEYAKQETEYMYWGKKHEPNIVDAFRERHPELQVLNFPYTVRSKEHPWMIANVDRLLYDPATDTLGVLECKSADGSTIHDWDDDQAPWHATCQSFHYMIVFGLTWGYVAGLIGGNTFRDPRIEITQEILENLPKTEQEFWALVETKTPPPIDSSDNTRRALSMLYPGEEDEEIDLTDDVWVNRLEERDRLAKLKKETEAALEGLSNLFAFEMKNATIAKVGARDVKYKRVNRKGYFVQPKTFRQFYWGKEAEK